MTDPTGPGAGSSAVSPTGPSPPAPPLQARFVEEARAIAVEVFEESSAAAVRARVTDLVRGQPTLAWDPEHLPYGVGEVLADAELIPASADLAIRATAAVGLTGCDGAIAATGALVLGSRAGRPRTASLLPPLHVAVLRPEQLVPELVDAVTPELLASCSTLNLVAGPSRTADIELTLTLGVHGPRRVLVVIGP